MNVLNYSKIIRMNSHKLLALLLSFLATATTCASELSQKLESTDYVLLMRHTRAPGVGDPANYSLNDCQSQRNLSIEGRKQAVIVGNWLRKQNVKLVDVYSSEWCRCKDTAELLNFGPYKIEPSLASFFDEMHEAKERTKQLESFIARQVKTKGNKALILVTHHVNIFEFMGENIASGDMVLAKVDSNGRMVSYKLIPRPD